MEECVCRVVQFVVKMKAGDSVLSKVWTNLWPFMSLKASDLSPMSSKVFGGEVSPREQ